jgi:hypothetical protein
MKTRANYRHGVCLRCGQCCGAEGGEAWPKNMMERFRKTINDNGELVFTHVLGLFINQPDEGALCIDDKVFPYSIIDGVPTIEDGWCPFLVHDERNEQYLCGLVGTSEQARFEATCQPIPVRIMNDRDKKFYKDDYPKCSYVWLDKPEPEGAGPRFVPLVAKKKQ